MNKASTLILAVQFLFASAAFCQPMSNKSIDTLVQHTLETFNVPGIAVAVVKDGKVVYAKGYGVRSLKAGKKVDDQTMFGIASNSKAFTAVALGILADEGKLNWDDKVRQYIPEFKMFDPYVTEAFTIRDLLTHRSGLGLGAGDLMLFPDHSDFTINDVIHNLQFLKPVSSFRSKFDYDNNMYILAGEIVARVSGLSWETFVEQRIFKPLGMTHSAAAYDRLRDKTNAAQPHAPVNGTVQQIERDNSVIMDAAGGINSSIADLSLWVNSLLYGAVYDSNKHLVSESTMRELWSPQTILRVGSPGPYNTHFSAYGLGFFLSDVKGFKQVSHTGGLAGMVTQITMIPELKLGIIVLTNQQDGNAFSAITNQIKDSYLGITNTDRVKEYAARRTSADKEAKQIKDSVLADVEHNYTGGGQIPAPTFGTYKDDWFGEIIISNEMRGFRFTSKRSPRLKGDLRFLKANTWVVQWDDRSMDADAYVNFVLDEAGEAKSFTMYPISPSTDFSYDFQDLNPKLVKKPK